MPVNSFENYPMSWKPVKKELKRPYYRALAEALEQEILEGRLVPDTKLPPQRELADFLDLNLSTITRAYKLCELKGLLYAVTGRGTFVAPGVSAGDTFLNQENAMIELGMVRPFYQCSQMIQAAAGRVLASPDSLRLFEYGDPFGTGRQLRAAARWLNRFGVPADESRILLTSGAQNALSVILISLFKAGSKIGADRFTYTNFKGLAGFLHIQLIPIDGDAFGMTPEALLYACRHTDLEGLYLMPSCNNPSALFMPETRRQELAAIIRHYKLLVIEDDIYSFLRQGREPSFYSLLPEQTVHICSISKSLCPGLRTAFMAVPPACKEILTRGMLNINLRSAPLNGEILAELIDSGDAGRILKQKLRLARERNQIFQSVFPQEATDDIPRFFHWLPLPEGLTSEEAECLALEKGVRILGSHRFALTGQERSSYVRAAITSPATSAKLQRGLLILKEIFDSKQAGISPDT